LRRLSLELVSERPGCAPRVCEALVKALAEGKKRAMSGNKNGVVVWERDPLGERITLGGQTWENRSALKARCQELLRRYQEDARLDDADSSFMRGVLEHHPRGQQKLQGLEAIIVGIHPVHKARCFYVLRATGREDFSYLRCIDNAATDEIAAQQQICDALCKILQLHPACCEQVAQYIEGNFPSYHGREGAVVEKHRNWTNSILELCTRMPALTEFLLRVLVRRMVEIDAAIHKMEDDVSHEDVLGAGEAPLEEVDKEVAKVQKLNTMAHILDAKMMMVFEYLQRRLAGPVGDAENRFVSALLGIFENTVLLTHRARCVQFLWFYVVSLRPAWAEAFLSLLLHTAFSPCAAIPKRLISLAYLASFVARAKFLTKNFTLRTAQYVSTLAREHMQVAEGHLNAGERVHPQLVLFLYAVQAMCYILCFHMADFASPEAGESPCRTALELLLREGAPEVGAEAFAPVLESTANPISRINKQVADQFCHCLRRVSPGMAAVVQQRMEDFAGQTRSHFCQGEEAGLDIFFPFDPYRLRHSSMFVVSIYRDWCDDDESNIDPSEGPEGFAKAVVPTNSMARQASDAASDAETGSDVDFTDAQHATERGFIPSVGPSPAFRPRGSTDMADIMSPLCMPMESAYEEDEVFALPSASVPLDSVTSSMLDSLMNSAAYREGRHAEGTAIAR